MELVKIIGVALVTAFAALFLRGTKPELSFAVTIAGAVIIAVPRRPFPTSFRPVALVLVALAIAHALSGPDVKYLFDAFCHIIRSFFTACCRPRRFLHFAPLRAKCVLGYAGRACLRGQALSSGSEVKTSVNTHPVCRDTMHLV